MINNDDEVIVKHFGEEWSYFTQKKLSDVELELQFNTYFNIFPKNILNNKAVGFDAGAGTGRWAKIVSTKVNKLYLIEPSEAIKISKELLKDKSNCYFINKEICDDMLENESMDFGYCLGVLHHTNDPVGNLNICIKKLKKGGYFLLYLYYNLENRPLFYKLLWLISDYLRRFLCKLPKTLKIISSILIAFCVYLPFVFAYKSLKILNKKIINFPLSSYENRSFYSMCTDAYDRFTTPVEKRYSKIEIYKMMKSSGLDDIVFNDSMPYWCAVGVKK